MSHDYEATDDEVTVVDLKEALAESETPQPVKLSVEDGGAPHGATPEDLEPPLNPLPGEPPQQEQRGPNHQQPKPMDLQKYFHPMNHRNKVRRGELAEILSYLVDKGTMVQALQAAEHGLRQYCERMIYEKIGEALSQGEVTESGIILPPGYKPDGE